MKDALFVIQLYLPLAAHTQEIETTPDGQEIMSVFLTGLNRDL